MPASRTGFEKLPTGCHQPRIGGPPRRIYERLDAETVNGLRAFARGLKNNLDLGLWRTFWNGTRIILSTIHIRNWIIGGERRARLLITRWCGPRSAGRLPAGFGGMDPVDGWSTQFGSARYGPHPDSLPDPPYEPMHRARSTRSAHGPWPGFGGHRNPLLLQPRRQKHHSGGL